MKRILGLDLGTNSIGWALIEQDFGNNRGDILGMGSRIIPMTKDIKDEFGKGNSISQTADRTKFRGTRRLRERHLLRRSRLHRVLNTLGFLPEHYAHEIDFDKRLGQFLEEKEPKLAYNNKEFVFKTSFNEMLEDFKQYQSQLLINKNGQPALVPYDWTIYYLRKKALSKKITKQELAWIILNFNQKRGYYQLRGEEEEGNPNKLVEFHSLKIAKVIADEKPNSKGETWYSLQLENSWVYRRSSKTPLFDWQDQVKDFIVTTDLNDDGTVKTDKEGAEKRSFRAPSEDDWTLIKKKTEQEIDRSHKTVGTYIYDTLLQNPKQKIKGKLVRTIERKFYRDELKQILQKQIELQPELFTDALYNDCIRELYRSNEVRQLQLSKRDFVHLFVEDIIFYQRPLRSQKSSIGNCSLEYRKYKDENGIEKTDYLKAIPKSNPLYQEFRLWQWLYNLKLYTKDEDKDVTANFLQSTEDYEQLFDFLNERKEVKQDALIKYFIEQIGLKGKALTNETAKYRWNYVEDKVYPCNETGTQLKTRLSKVENVPLAFLTPEIEYSLWHLIYSVTDKVEFEKALKSFAVKHRLDEVSFVENFRKFPPFKSEYGAFSEKAIKKLLPLMRLGKYWSEDEIVSGSEVYFKSIEKLLGTLAQREENISDEDRQKWNKTINQKLREELEVFQDAEIASFQGLRLHIAQYLVYGRHSEASDIEKWHSVADLEKYLEAFKQHSLRNPIVEQVVTETLRVVKDIWSKYGNGAKDFFNEIHIELGREMKNTADERKRMTNIVTENENTNLRIKALLAELLNDKDVENVRPFSPMQQEVLKVYEDGVLGSNIDVPDDILKISKTAQPTKSELQRYKLWLEQKYRSPYTGQMIPLNKLFTSEYEIEHIIPQSRFFDDSFSNKVICESAINKLKDKQLGFEFIKSHYGTIVETGFGRTVRVFEEEAYQEFVKDHYGRNRSKRNKLLMDEIPDKMIERQLNDTRYISKFVSGVLSKIVREDNHDDGVNSKNVLPGNGKVTSTLRQDWGLNDVWNNLILPRFERMNLLTGSASFTAWNENHQKFLPTVPLEYSKGFSKKRIDHRHHALDALVIACATRDHINLLNNQSAKSQTKRYDLQKKLRNTEPYFDKKEDRQKEKFTTFKKPWDNFTAEVQNNLESIVVSFKQNLRVINKTTNKYEKLVEKNGKLVKELVAQTNGDSWAIRQSLHEETVSGIVNLSWVKLGKGEITTATRERNDLVSIFKDVKTKDKAESKIGKITDTGIQKILINYLKSKGDNPELAFSPEGIEDMNKNISQFNNGKHHHPIFKVRVYEKGSGRFKLGIKGNKKDKYVQGAPNLFFGVYLDKDGNRSFETIPLDRVIERQKQKLNPVPEKKTIEKKREPHELNLLFHLSPDDLIYVPTEEEKVNIRAIDFNNLTTEQIKRVFFVNDFSGATCYFRPNHIAKAIIAKEIDMNYDEKNNKITGSFDTKTASLDNKQIKDICIKLKVDRLGNISKA